MSDPLRWSDDPEAPEGAADLLRSARKGAPPMPDDVRTRVGVAVAAMTAGTAATASASVGAGVWTAGKITSAIAILVTGGALIGGGIYAYTRSDETPRSLSPAPHPRAAPLAVSPPPQPPAEVAPIAIRESEPRVAPHIEPSRPAPRPSLDPLEEETRLIQQAHAQLEAHPDRALALASSHARRFPEGQLAAERELVAIDALARLGRLDQARARAARLDERYPSSPYHARAQRILSRSAP